MGVSGLESAGEPSAIADFPLSVPTRTSGSHPRRLDDTHDHFLPGSSSHLAPDRVYAAGNGKAKRSVRDAATLEYGCEPAKKKKRMTDWDPSTLDADLEAYLKANRVNNYVLDFMAEGVGGATGGADPGVINRSSCRFVEVNDGGGWSAGRVARSLQRSLSHRGPTRPGRQWTDWKQ